MYCFPAFPDGKRNKFLFPYTICSYIVDTFASNTWEGELPTCRVFVKSSMLLYSLLYLLMFLCTRIFPFLDHIRSYSIMFCLHDLKCWFKPLFDRKVLSQCQQIRSSPFALIRTNAMNSGVSLDIFTFKQLLSIVLALIATLCAPKIYFEYSKIYQSHCR